MKWSVETFKEQGKSVTVLSRGVPETDNVKMYAACATGEPVELVISADVGKRKNGTSASLRFSGNGDRFTIQGQVVGVGNTEEAIAGIRAELAKTSPLWGAMAASEKLTYQIGKGNAGSLALSDGQRSISEFLSKCDISPASGQRQTASAPTTGSGDSQSSGGSQPEAPKREVTQNTADGGGISEKEAFESAKELGTIEGWEAFLNRFSTGFRADLARAYVKRLASSEGPKRAGGSDQPASGQQSEPPPEETQPLEPAEHEPGTSPWTNSNQRMELADNKSVYTASVKAGGLELVTFCMDNKAFGGSGKGLGATIRQLDDGVYPRFDDRVEQGLRNSRELGEGPEREILIEFDNGKRVNRAAAQPDPIAGSLFFGPRGRPFTANSSGLANLLSGNTVTVELDPLRATFQLKNSRNAICKVMNRCGARVPGCGRGTSGRDRGERFDRDFVEPPTFIYQPGPRRRCSGGRYFSRRAQACVCPASRPRWNGRRCRPARIIRQCGPNRRWSAARRRCIPIVRQCGPGRRWATRQQRCVCIAPRTRWNGRACVAIRPNCRPGTIPNAQGRCVPIVRQCGPGRRWAAARRRCVCIVPRTRWNGRRCVTIRPNCRPGTRPDARGRCIPIVRQCGPGRRWAAAQRRCVCIAPRTRWNGRACVAIRPNCRPGMVLNARGRCVCPGNRVWNGRACVNRVRPRPQPGANNKQVRCNRLRAACQAGRARACNRFRQIGC